MTYRLAAVFAHPDDDTYAVAGTLALEEGSIEYTVVVATSGEAGVISDPSLANKENLAVVREAEERAALAAAGAGVATVHFLRYPDGGLKSAPRGEVVDRVTGFLLEARPHVVVTFGPEGITKHEDHVAIGQIATEAFHRARTAAGGEGGGDAFRRLYYTAIPRTQLEAFWDALRSRGAQIEPEGPFMPRGVPDETIAVRVDCSRVLRRKIEALRAHRTQQVELDDLPEDLWPTILGQECFVQAWPLLAGSGEPVRPRLFDGIDQVPD